MLQKKTFAVGVQALRCLVQLHEGRCRIACKLQYCLFCVRLVTTEPRAVCCHPKSLVVPGGDTCAAEGQKVGCRLALGWILP